MFEPVGLEGAEADDLPVILGQPDLAFREDAVAIEVLVVRQRVQRRQVGQEMPAGCPRDLCDGIRVADGRFAEGYPFGADDMSPIEGR